MKLHDMAQAGVAAVAAGAPPLPDVVKRLADITAVLQDALHQLGLTPQLQKAAGDLPDARSRLNYVVAKTAAAADKVLTSVDLAKLEQASIASRSRDLAARLLADPVRAVASGDVMNFVQEVERRTGAVDTHLTDIMMAQDFHDLTGQVVQKVVALADELESSLVVLLQHGAPGMAASPAVEPPHGLAGPVVEPRGRADVVNNQAEVDDLLASLGF